jgi:hypothetical protein
MAQLSKQDLVWAVLDIAPPVWASTHGMKSAGGSMQRGGGRMR